MLTTIPLATLQIITPDITFFDWSTVYILTIGNLFRGTIHMSFQQLQDTWHVASKEFFKYLRIRSVYYVKWSEDLTIWHVISFYNQTPPPPPINIRFYIYTKFSLIGPSTQRPKQCDNGKNYYIVSTPLNSGNARSKHH